MNYFDTRHTTVFDLFDFTSIGFTIQCIRWPTRDMLQIKKVAANIIKLLQIK